MKAAATICVHVDSYIDIKQMENLQIVVLVCFFVNFKRLKPPKTSSTPQKDIPISEKNSYFGSHPGGFQGYYIWLYIYNIYGYIYDIYGYIYIYVRFR